jgi:hypothetical protein
MAGALVFREPTGRVDLHDWSQWWSFLEGANWRHPYGPVSSIEGRDDRRLEAEIEGVRRFQSRTNFTTPADNALLNHERKIQ